MYYYDAKPHINDYKIMFSNNAGIRTHINCKIDQRFDHTANY